MGDLLERGRQGLGQLAQGFLKAVVVAGGMVGQHAQGRMGYQRFDGIEPLDYFDLVGSTGLIVEKLQTQPFGQFFDLAQIIEDGPLAQNQLCAQLVGFPGFLLQQLEQPQQPEGFFLVVVEIIWAGHMAHVTSKYKCPLSRRCPFG